MRSARFTLLTVTVCSMSVLSAYAYDSNDNQRVMVTVLDEKKCMWATYVCIILYMPTYHLPMKAAYDTINRIGLSVCTIVH